jgi:hypothetical protein
LIDEGFIPPLINWRRIYRRGGQRRRWLGMNRRVSKHLKRITHGDMSDRRSAREYVKEGGGLVVVGPRRYYQEAKKAYYRNKREVNLPRKIFGRRRENG